MRLGGLGVEARRGATSACPLCRVVPDGCVVLSTAVGSDTVVSISPSEKSDFASPEVCRFGCLERTGPVRLCRGVPLRIVRGMKQSDSLVPRCILWNIWNGPIRFAHPDVYRFEYPELSDLIRYRRVAPLRIVRGMKKSDSLVLRFIMSDVRSGAIRFACLEVYRFECSTPRTILHVIGIEGNNRHQSTTVVHEYK